MRRASDLYAALVAEEPHFSFYRSELAITCYDLASYLQAQQCTSEAERYFQRAIDARRTLVDEAPTSERHLALALTHNALASLYLDEHRLGDAEEAYRASLEIFRKLAGQTTFPGVVPWCLGDTCCTLTVIILRNTGRAQEANELCRQVAQECRSALAVQKQLVDARNLATDRLDLAGSLESLARLLNELDELPEAIRCCRDAISIREKLAADSNTESDRFLLAVIHDRLGELLRRQGRAEEAEQAYRTARAIYEPLAAESNDEGHRKHLAWTNELLGELAEAAGRLDDAATAYRQAVEVWQKLVADHNLPDHRARLAQAQFSLARLLVRQGKDVEAVPVAAALDDPELQNSLAWSIVDGSDAPPRAVTLSVELAKKAVERAPEPSYWNTLGVAQYRAGDWNAVLEALNTSQVLCRGDSFSFDAFFLAMAHWQRGDHDQARKFYSPALVWMEKHGPKNEELVRFRTEAANLLGLPEQLSAEQEQAKSDDAKYYTLVIEAFPKAGWPHSLRAQIHAKSGQLDQAKADSAKAIELSPDDVVLRYWEALARLTAGDLSEYRGACAAMLDRFGHTDNPDVAHWLAWSAVLGPRAVDDPNRAIALAEAALGRNPGNGWFSNTLGAALYRAGRFDDAVAKLNQVNTAWEQAATKPVNYSPAYSWFFLALAHHRLGHADEARRWLDQAVTWMEREIKNSPPWNRRLTLELLRREAESAVNESPDAPPTTKQEEDATLPIQKSKSKIEN
jgi:tetratricopeptide (TPR) repeat protein